MLGRRCCSAEHKHPLAGRMHLSDESRNARNRQGALSSPGMEKLQLEVLCGLSPCSSKDIGVPHLFGVGSLLELGMS